MRLKRSWIPREILRPQFGFCLRWVCNLKKRRYLSDRVIGELVGWVPAITGKINLSVVNGKVIPSMFSLRINIGSRKTFRTLKIEIFASAYLESKRSKYIMSIFDSIFFFVKILIAMWQFQ